MTQAASSHRPLTISFAGRSLDLSPDGIAWVPDLKLLCAADMHFEKGSFFSRCATFLPPYDSADNLDRLKQVLTFYQPNIVVAVGDSFHDRHAALRLPLDQRDVLNGLISAVPQWHWLSGNHDPELDDVIKGLRREVLRIGNIIFRHQTAGSGEINEISGHYHPKLRLKIRGHLVSGPCFARQDARLILPSFGQYTGGLDVASDAFNAVMPARQRQCYLLHSQQVFAV